MYDIIFRLQQSNLDSNFADKVDDFMDAAPNLESLNGLKRPRVLNTHLLPEFLSANILQNVMSRSGVRSTMYFNGTFFHQTDRHCFFFSNFSET